MIGGIGLAVDLDAADPAGQIFRRKNKIATIRAVRPLHAIVQSQVGDRGWPGWQMVHASR